ncbi:carbohydrate ABC transporter permease [Rubellimicrobium roseum]|uniref:Sugar ABC transporter permease n=1 Tax=Rubellimicrobium roseum TaxID=687525 RepID=A0A5C4NEB3_9RHOB|nr:sugar ABC transporter permease [Rubellimicrobium roseum]TNC72225.1 sugar ABC transporter permease [Rubellimicrobium roseum]
MRRLLSSKAAAPWLFLGPAILFALVFVLLPVGFAAYISLTDWDSLSPPRWVGLGNYRYLLTTDPVFLRTLWQTLLFALGALILGVPLALGLAFAFSRSRHQAAWRVAYTLPMVTNIVAIGFIFTFVFRQTDGALNRLLALFGLPGPGWLTDPSLTLLSATLVFVWMELGRNMLLFAAGLTSIDESYYEAAKLDGAGTWQLFRFVTLPLLRPTILFVVLTGFISGMSYFTLMLVLFPGTQGGPGRAALTTGQYMYQMAFEDLRMGRASAVSYVLFALVFVATLVQVRLLRRGGLEQT